MAAIDMRLDPPEPGRWISEPLATAVSERLAAGEQALLFLNRRGYAPLTLCRACGPLKPRTTSRGRPSAPAHLDWNHGHVD